MLLALLPGAPNVVSLRDDTDRAAPKPALANLDRLQLIFDDTGQPLRLHAAPGEQDPFKGTPSFNLQFAIQAASSIS